MTNGLAWPFNFGSLFHKGMKLDYTEACLKKIIISKVMHKNANKGSETLHVDLVFSP